MKKSTFLAFFLAIVCLASCTDNTPKTATPTAETPATTAEDAVKRGEYLVQITGCNDCHSAKRMGANGPEIIPETMLAGYPADRPIMKFKDPILKQGFAMFYPDLTAGAGPWGVSFAGNLTPDETGIGNWTEEQFKKALTQGKYKGLDGGRMLLPPMPWVNYTKMADADVKAIFAYLKSIKPVNNLVPQPISPENM
jgi:mono/diheme cytochrome c family protein